MEQRDQALETEAPRLSENGPSPARCWRPNPRILVWSSSRRPPLSPNCVPLLPPALPSEIDRKYALSGRLTRFPAIPDVLETKSSSVRGGGVLLRIVAPPPPLPIQVIVPRIRTRSLLFPWREGNKDPVSIDNTGLIVIPGTTPRSSLNPIRIDRKVGVGEVNRRAAR